MANPLIVLIGLSGMVAGQPSYGGGAQSSSRLPPEPAVRAPQTAPAATTPVAPGRALKDVPNVTIKYYDVSGKNLAAIAKSIEGQRRRNAATGRPAAGGVSWTLGVKMTQSTAGNICKITRAKSEFAGIAEVPRLLEEQRLPARQLAAWRTFVAGIEGPAAARLWFVVDRLPAFEQSFIGKPCASAPALAAAAIDKLKRDQAAFELQQAKAVAAAPVPPTK